MKYLNLIKDHRVSSDETEQEGYLLNEIITITKDSKSKFFWLKAINTLGENRVEMELGELKYQMRTGQVEQPAKYLTALLQKQIKQTSVPEQKKNSSGEKLKTFFETTQIQLFTDLQPIKPKGEVEEQEMEIPYGKKKIPWTTFLSSSFFTLSTNKAKSDKVLVKFRTLDGQVTIIPMIRGRIGPGGKERGILTAQHAKILAALKNMWAQQGCSYNSYSNGAKICSCYVSARELAKLLGWKKFGGRDLIWLRDMVYDLKIIPYHLDLSGLGIKDINGYGFSLLEKVSLVDGKKHGQDETVFHIEFSVPLSVQLINRHAVTKSMDMLTVRTELATLLRLYLEPILISLNGLEYSKQLKDIISDLQLPKASWHQRTFERKRTFEKVIKELNAHYIADDKKMTISIEKGIFDYMLTARLVEQQKAMG
jgi:hypothetical protein